MLNKKNRLKNTRDFQSVYKKGKYVVSKQIVIYYFKNSSADLRIGFVSSKKVGNSCVRSRCKRLMREAMRELLPEMPLGFDIVVVARQSLPEEDFNDVYKVMAKLLRKAKLIGDRV